MKHAATSLAALAVVALVAGTVEARGRSHPKASHGQVTLVKHGGSHGSHHGYRSSHGHRSHHGYRGHHGHGSHHRSHYGYHHGCYRPWGHPPVFVHPHVYRYRYPSYGYVYRPSSSFYYRGNGFGLSIGF